ncbi:MAG: hypothetical protein ACYS9Y_11120 [Planctomycetota bacterium]|jgi:hypothetical protein
MYKLKLTYTRLSGHNLYSSDVDGVVDLDDLEIIAYHWLSDCN